MNEQILKDYETLLEHWNTVFRLTREEKDRSEWTAREDGWKDLTPSEKLIEAAASLKDCKNVLDYGSGCGWAGIAMAKYGCQNIYSYTYKRGCHRRYCTLSRIKCP